MKHIIKQAKKFIRKTGTEPTFEKSKKFIEKKGYCVILFDKNCDEIKAYGLQDVASKKEAFTYCDNVRIVFIKKSLDEHTKLTHLLHEIGHILLGHLENDVLQPETKELEAEAFSYYAFHGFSKTQLPNKVVLTLLTLLLCFSVALNLIMIFRMQHAEPVLAVSVYSAEENENLYFITPTGNKYHTKNCVYAINGVSVPEEYAVSNYLPCSICNPN